ncbi:MAG: V-type ATP synthase subunit A [Gemmatimonadales bacterium]|jgi:V/A-type H+-transporting ATPase subunit A
MNDSSEARLVRVVGALVEAAPLAGVRLYELMRVGARGLLGEVIRLDGERATIQVFEETTGLRLGEPVRRTGSPLSIELGPGLLGSVLDGVGRPLERLAQEAGAFVRGGVVAPTLDPDREWAIEPVRAVGDVVHAGDVLVRLPDGGPSRVVLVPPGTEGRIAELASGPLRIGDPVARLVDGQEIGLSHEWPVRRPRPVAGRLPADRPFLTGQRVFDFLFPVAEGGAVAVPGGFGTGKTVIEQTLARYAEADVVVYVGCGERGNEMAEVLEQFPALEDPRTGGSIMARTVLIVNTSNMPVAAREASIYLGMTVAEYFRDQGLRVALMADSLSRWAEALREIGSRLQEMPGEEGYPTYLGNRLGHLYERAGRVRCLGAPDREGAVTFVSAVSPPGGDFSEPVTQASLRVCGALWGLDPALAHQRHFPAVDWETSYSLYTSELDPWFRERLGSEWARLRGEVTELLQKDRELREVAALVGPEALEDADRVRLEIARLVRDQLLAQNAYDPVDAFSRPERILALAELLLSRRDRALDALAAGRSLEELDFEATRRLVDRVRSAPESELDERVREAREAIEGAEAVSEPSAGEGGP